MNKTAVIKLMDHIDKEYITLGVDDLKIILALFDKNPNLLKDYPALEDARNTVKRYIGYETERISLQSKNFQELYDN